MGKAAQNNNKERSWKTLTWERFNHAYLMGMGRRGSRLHFVFQQRQAFRPQT